MVTTLLTHPSSEKHATPEGHPERPDRIRAVNAALAVEAFSGLDRRFSRHAEPEELALAHSPAYVEALFAASPSEGLVAIDADTVMSPASIGAARHTAGAVLDGVDLVMTGQSANAFCATRPPGHHAEPNRPMGFCLFNSIAIGAHYARNTYGIERVAVVDFDVHHGNGTQAAFWDIPDFLYASTHQMPLFPGTGAASERGANGRNIVNAPLPPGAGGLEFRSRMTEVILPALREFRPELLLVSAGFDAHRRDPLANLMLEVGDFSWVTQQLMAVAADCCDRRLVSTLEGGYDLVALAECVSAHVDVLMS